MFKNIRTVALASFIDGVITLVWLSSIPASGGIFSPVRLTSLLGILLIALGGLAVFIRVKSENRFVQKTEWLADSKSGLLVSWLLVITSLSLWVTILYKSWLITIVDEAVYTRLLPIAVLGVLLCLQLGLLFLMPNVSKDTWIDLIGPIWKTTLMLLGCFLAVWVLMSATHIGFVFDNVGLSWGPPGTPLSFSQINLVFAVSISLVFAYNIIISRISLKKIPVRDIVIFAGLWGLAVILWWNVPASETHFNPPPMAPNYETYPSSDAWIFDRSAYHLLFGTGFSNQLVRRPLYVGMLALFHKLGGFGYEDTIFLQILILAFIPSLTYLLTSKLSNRLAGLIAGGLILLREKNAIELSDKIVTSNAKLMMSDMVAMLGVIAFMYVMVKVLSSKECSIWLLGIAGACLGLTALVRAQVLILLPLLLLFIIINRRPLKFGLKDATLVMLGCILVISPWAWRNFSLTGTFVLDDRGEEKLLARNYSSSPGNLPSPLPSETEKEFSTRIKKDILTFMVEHPSDVAFFVSNHFFRNLATGTVYMASLLSTDSLRVIVDRTLFWDEWKGMISVESGISIFITLILLALGVTVSQGRKGLAGWFPLATFLFYSAGNALVRTSGWRFSIPVDWVILVYYSIGLAYLPSRIRLVFDGSVSLPSDFGFASVSKKSYSGVIVFCILILIGASVPIAERLVPARDFSNVTDKTKDRMLLEKSIPRDEIETFLAQENAFFYSGIALYPRYIGDNSRIYLAYTPKDFTYLHFWLINDGDNQIVLPLQNSPDTFPHTSTVSVIGCKEDHYILAWAVILHTTSADKVIMQDAPSPLSCP